MASRDKIFLDADVALDHLADRQPFAEYAHRIFALAETGELAVCVDGDANAADGLAGGHTSQELA